MHATHRCAYHPNHAQVLEVAVKLQIGPPEAQQLMEYVSQAAMQANVTNVCGVMVDDAPPHYTTTTLLPPLYHLKHTVVPPPYGTNGQTNTSDHVDTGKCRMASGATSTITSTTTSILLQKLDDALRGGVPCGRITELVGPAGVSLRWWWYSALVRASMRCECSTFLIKGGMSNNDTHILPVCCLFTQLVHTVPSKGVHTNHRCWKNAVVFYAGSCCCRWGRAIQWRKRRDGVVFGCRAQIQCQPVCYFGGGVLCQPVCVCVCVCNPPGCKVALSSPVLHYKPTHQLSHRAYQLAAAHYPHLQHDAAAIHSMMSNISVMHPTSSAEVLNTLQVAACGCMSVFVYTCVCICVGECLSFMYLYICVFVHICVCTCVFVHMCVYIYVLFLTQPTHPPTHPTPSNCSPPWSNNNNNNKAQQVSVYV